MIRLQIESTKYDILLSSEETEFKNQLLFCRTQLPDGVIECRIVIFPLAVHGTHP